MKYLIAGLLAVLVSPAHASFANCDESSFVTAEGSVHIAIEGTSYSPKCLRIKAGTQVTIDASPHHPLQGVGENNPIFDEFGGAVSPKTVVFDQSGEYGYFCIAHGDDTGAGMAATILVE